MHSQCFNEEIDLLLKDGELTDADAVEARSAGASVLGISNEDASQAIAAKTVPIYVDATRKAVDNAIAADEAAQKALGADAAFYWNFNVTRSRRWRRRDAASRRWRRHDHDVHASRRRPCHTGDELETLRKKLRLEDATAEGVFKDAVKGVFQAPYTAASSASSSRTRRVP